MTQFIPTRPPKTKRILPAAQYDALKAAADKNGGVGSGQMRDEKGCGVCGYGLALQAGILVPPPADVLMAQHLSDDPDRAVESWLYEQSEECALPFAYNQSDDAVCEVRVLLNTPKRVPFEAWAAELGLVRGEEGE